jgi:hypothetical protein
MPPISGSSIFEIGVGDFTISHYSNAAHRAQAIALWNAVFGYEAAHNKPALVIDKKLAVNDELFFVALSGNAVIGDGRIRRASRMDLFRGRFARASATRRRFEIGPIR